MAFKVEVNGKIIEFQNRPTEADIDEATKGISQKKKAWEISTPEQLVKQGYKPGVAATLATGQQLSDPLWKYGNMLLGGLPNKALQSMGYEAPTTDIKAAIPFLGEKNISPAINALATVGGFARGLPMKMAGGAAGLLPAGGRFVSRVGLGALRGATRLGGAAGLTTPLQEPFKDIRARGMRTAGAGALGLAAGGVGGVISHFAQLLKQPALLKTGEQTRAGFQGMKARLTNWFGGKIDKFQKANPKQKVDVSQQLKEFEKGLEDKAKFKSLLRSSPRLRQAISKKGNLTLKETQDLVNQLKSGVSEGQLAGFKVRPSGREVTSFIDSLQKQKHVAFPTMKFTDAAYGKMKNYFRSVETYMKYGKTVKGLKTMFSNPETRKSLSMILPEDIFQKVSQTVMAQRLTHQGMRAIDYIIRYGIMYRIARNLTENINLDGDGGEGQYTPE